MFKRLCLLFCLLLSLNVGAHPFSYVYIQGDKSVPFYVKLNGQMQPRYGQYHCIIPELDSGVIHLEILFQQRVYPSQKFAVAVPGNGQRGFLLNKKGNSFVLYDLADKKEILPE